MPPCGTWFENDERLAALARAGVSASFADPASKGAVERDIDGWLDAEN